MKRVLSFTIFFAVLIIAFQFIVTYFNQGHKITYSYQKNENVYDITEELVIVNKKAVYNIQIQLGNNTFLLENKTNYNKQKKIISDIFYFEQDDIKCLVPIYHNKIEDVHDPICIKDNNQYTYTYLKNKYPSINAFQTLLQSEGFVLPSWQTSSEPKEYRQIKIYQDDIPNNLYLGIWQYQGLEIVSNNTENYTSLLSTDSYLTKGILVDNYYVIPEFNTTTEFTNILITDVTRFGLMTLELGFSISNDCYFNGVVDGKAYLFDRNAKKQYEINPRNKTIREIGNTEINAQFYDGTTWSDRNIYDFVNQRITFDKDYSKIVELNSNNAREIIETENSYYLIDHNYNLYRFYKNKLTNPILLCQIDDMKELRITNDYIFFLSRDTLYLYSETTGLKPIVKYNEFLYNNKDMYIVYYR